MLRGKDFWLALQLQLGASPVAPFRVVSNRVASPQPDPLGHGPVLAGLLGKLHLGEVSFPDGFKKPVFSYVGLLACPSPGHSGARFALGLRLGCGTGSMVGHWKGLRNRL